MWALVASLVACGKLVGPVEQTARLVSVDTVVGTAEKIKFLKLN